MSMGYNPPPNANPLLALQLKNAESHKRYEEILGRVRPHSRGAPLSRIILIVQKELK